MPFLIADQSADPPIELYFERFGQGDRVLYIGGSGADLRTSNPGGNPLARHFDVVFYDQRGLGQATLTGQPFTMADYAQDAIAVLDELGWERAHVVGTSFGGMVAAEVAIRYPRRVAKLALNCTSPGGRLASFPIEELEKLDSEAALEMRLGLLDNRWDPGADDPIPGLGAGYDVLIERARRGRTPEAQAGYLNQLGARSAHDVSTRLHQIGAETLVCAGEYDDQAPIANSLALAEGIPNATLRVFQGGHMFLVQDKSAYPTIIGWLQSGSPDTV